MSFQFKLSLECYIFIPFQETYLFIFFSSYSSLSYLKNIFLVLVLKLTQEGASQLPKYNWMCVFMSHQFLITVPTITDLPDKLISAVFTPTQDFLSSGRMKSHKLFINKTEANILGECMYIYIHGATQNFPRICS